MKSRSRTGQIKQRRSAKWRYYDAEKCILVIMFGGRTDHSLGGYSTKVYMGMVPPEVQPLTPI